MIDIQLLTKKDVDRKVVYRPFGGRVEHGAIAGWSVGGVFVSYGGASVSLYTSPDDLTFLNGSYDELVEGKAEFWLGDNPPKIS